MIGIMTSDVRLNHFRFRSFKLVCASFSLHSVCKTGKSRDHYYIIPERSCPNYRDVLPSQELPTDISITMAVAPRYGCIIRRTYWTAAGLNAVANTWHQHPIAEWNPAASRISCRSKELLSVRRPRSQFMVSLFTTNHIRLTETFSGGRLNPTSLAWALRKTRHRLRPLTDYRM
jgi:hypothetical protein